MEKDKKIMICIGGGEIGRPGTGIETKEIDLRIKKLTKKDAPKFLFIPTASGDSNGYCEVVKKYFGEQLGFKVNSLLLIAENDNYLTIKNKILSSDVIYIGGGNTKRMIEKWKEKGVDKLLKEAWTKGIILSGLSAGMNCFFEMAITDSDIISSDSENLSIMNSLGFIKGCVCPHFDVERNRKPFVEKSIENGDIASIFALENKTALEIHSDNEFYIIKSDSNAKVYFIDNKLNYTELKPDKKYNFSDFLNLHYSNKCNLGIF